MKAFLFTALCLAFGTQAFANPLPNNHFDRYQLAVSNAIANGPSLACTQSGSTWLFTASSPVASYPLFATDGGSISGTSAQPLLIFVRADHNGEPGLRVLVSTSADFMTVTAMKVEVGYTLPGFTPDLRDPQPTAPSFNKIGEIDCGAN
jgi:hypothetical protein